VNVVAAEMPASAIGLVAATALSSIHIIGGLRVRLVNR
jgi:hypothetical protein